MSRKTYPHVNAMNGYARDVVKGKTPACKLVRAACQRHLDDLEAVKRTDYAFEFSKDSAEHACAFIEALPHVKGKWASQSELLHLEPWQVFVVGSVFGWVHKRSGNRRYRYAYIEVPRKSGKSMLAAAVGLYMLAADGEFGAEVYCGATSEKQAWEVFRPAKQMALVIPPVRLHPQSPMPHPAPRPLPATPHQSFPLEAAHLSPPA